MIFKNVISWFQIPSAEINRAQKFYEAIFGIEMIAIEHLHQCAYSPWKADRQ